jgi:hypothetical protein
MVHYIIRRTLDKEPIALVRINAKDGVDMVIQHPIIHPRFGAMAKVSRFVEDRGSHVHAFNLMIGDNEEVAKALQTSVGYQLEKTTKAEWESFNAFDLFPVLKLAMAR